MAAQHLPKVQRGRRVRCLRGAVLWAQRLGGQGAGEQPLRLVHGTLTGPHRAQAAVRRGEAVHVYGKERKMGKKNLVQ